MRLGRKENCTLLIDVAANQGTQSLPENYPNENSPNISRQSPYIPPFAPHSLHCHSILGL